MYTLLKKKNLLLDLFYVLFVNQVTKDVSPTAAGVVSQTDGISKAVNEICSLQTDNSNVTKLNSENLSETVKDSHQNVVAEADKGTLRKRKRKPSSALRPEEDENTLETVDRYSHEGSSRRNGEKKDLSLTSERGNSSMLSNSLRKKIDSFSESSLTKNGQLKKKKSMINEHKDLEFSSTLKRKILKLKGRGYEAPKKKGKRVISGSGKIRVEKEGGVLGVTSKEGKHHLSPQELPGRKEIISHKYVHKDSAQKVIKFFFCLTYFARTSMFNCFGIIYADGGTSYF